VEWSVGEAVALRSPRQFENSSNASAPAKSFSHTESPRATEMNSIWKELIEKVKTQNFSIAGVLRGCAISRYDSKELVIETKYTFHKEKLEEKKIQELLEKVAKEITGKSIHVSVVLQEK